ncbi:hypothetical protein CYY_004872 [Polysphondylium violaceum]|uniref:SAP domain-containing protein n=1 Tax=Polysphondylium violaceum TaxID=133409 RepID=A0A8J4V7C5_9MYCE|nr:hypothetical protein CYY_004872 [Polysphondylium violaceum]
MSLTEEAINKLKVNELQKELGDRGLDTKGKKAELVSRLLENIQSSSSSSTATTASPTTTTTTAATTTTTETENENEINNNNTDTKMSNGSLTDVQNMTEEQRRLLRANKYNTTITPPTSSTSTTTPTTTSDKKADLEEERRKRMLKFGTSNVSITSPPPLPEPKSKVPKTKLNGDTPTKNGKPKNNKITKDNIQASTSEILERKKKFGTIEGIDGLSTPSAVSDRMKKFSTPSV